MEELRLTLGLHDSGAIGPMRLRLVMDGEVALSGEPDVGFLHRGIEKSAERMTWAGFMPYTDRVDYVAAIHCNLAYALAVESLASIQVPPRASQIRIVVGELNRIASHLLALGRLAQLLGMATALSYALRDRERVSNLFEMLCGARLTYNYIRIGGVAADITEGFIEKVYEFCEYVTLKLKEYNDLLSNNRIFAGRLGGVGVIPGEAAVDAGLSGPALRASGIKQDIRKIHSYCGYHKIDFDVPVGRGAAGSIGDAYDRHLVRLAEIEQSVGIIKQALDAMPSGEHKTPLPRLFQAPKGEGYAAVEGPRGAFGVYIRSLGGRGPDRLRFRAPSFAILNLFPVILKNVPLSDVSAIIASLDVAISEVDR